MLERRERHERLSTELRACSLLRCVDVAHCVAGGDADGVESVVDQLLATEVRRRLRSPCSCGISA